MRAGAYAIACVVAACGGKSPPPAKPAEPPPEVRAVRVPIEEPENEDQSGVTMVNARGRMDVDAVTAGLAPHTGELSDCYTSRVGRRRWLGGHVQLHWDIRATGEITAVEIADSDLGAWPVEKCLLDIARAATFAKPAGGDADFSIPLEFSEKGKPAIWDEDKSLHAIGGQLAKLDSCASDKPKRAPNKRGHRGTIVPAAVASPDDVTITVYVGPHGQAQSVGFASNKGVIDDAWADCAEKQALAWRLPDPRGEIAKLAIRYRAR